MYKALILILFCFFSSQLAFCQNIMPYREGRLEGLKDYSHDEIVVSARYKSCTYLKDSLFRVEDSSNEVPMFGVINSKGDTIFPFNFNYIYCNDSDSTHSGSLFEFSYKDFYYDESREADRREYYYLVDKNWTCIPSDYYPCPFWKKSFVSTPTYLTYIERGESYLEYDEIDSAIIACKRSIKEAPQNPFPYYWGANIILRMNYKDLYYNIFSDYSKYDALAKEWLEKAYSLENRRYYRIKTSTLLYNFYRFHLKSIPKSNAILSETKRYKPSTTRSGLFLFTGLEYSFDPYLEIGIGEGVFSEKSNPGFKDHYELITFGISYLKSLNSNIDAVKLYLFSITSPLRLGLCLIDYTNYKDNTIGLRPELGYTFKKVSLTYGYNIQLKNSFLNDESHHSFSLRYFIPIKTSIEFQPD